MSHKSDDITPTTEEVREYIGLAEIEYKPWEPPTDDLREVEKRRMAGFDRWLAEHDREVELKGRRAGLQEAVDIIGGEDPSGGMVSVTYLIRELYELINESQPADALVENDRD